MVQTHPKATPRSARLRSRLWVRLVAIAVLPVLGLLGVAASVTVSQNNKVRTSTDAAAHILRLGSYFRIATVVDAEHVPAQTAATVREFRIPPAFAQALLGFGGTDGIVNARAATDRLLAGSTDPVLRRVSQILADARTRIDDPASTWDASLKAYLTAKSLLSDAARREIEAVEAHTPSSESGVRRASTALTSAFDALQSSNQLTLPLFRVLTGGPEARASLRTLAEQTTLEDAALGRLARSAEVKTLRAVHTLNADPDSASFRALVGQSLDATPDVTPVAMPVATNGSTRSLGFARYAQLATIFRSGFRRSALYSLVLDAASNEAVTASRAAARDARVARLETMALSLFLALLSLSAALLAARSISRPLRRLARRARDVVDGAVGAAPLPEDGPIEVSVVTRALNDLAANLEVVEQQASALAAAQLDDPVLRSPAPGSLGVSIQSSVERLLQAMREGEELQEQLVHQARHDSLTGLANRAAAITTLDQSIARSRRGGGRVALLFLDLDGFKRGNDEYGHRFGDAVLCEIANRLIASVRSGDSVARLGGDEFVVVAEPIQDVNEAFELGQRLIDAVSVPIETLGKRLRVGASVGIAFDQDHRTDSATMLREADLAMYRAKALGRGRVEIFDDALRREHDLRAELEALIPDGLRNGEFRLDYQPITRAIGGEVTGLEALVRWHRPGHGVVAPSEFIPAAEATSVILDIGRWVLLTAAQQVAQWTELPGMGALHIAVNLSARHLLAPTVIADVRDALRLSGLAAERLVLEVTETVLLGDLATAVENLEAIRALGVRIALDDFGTGYTSINQLGRLPIDILKIDRSFVSNITRPQERSIVELVVEVAHTLDVGLVAEGVEDQEQLDVLRSLGCDSVQGYFVSRPIALSDVPCWVATRTAEVAV